ncbi:hypothetical protein RAM80_01280 [Pseudomonas sp. App30]|uniref:hypothetical protein n=1 Tax=Pseudomonas sp. App30 TaxID=3068990 RepID=UPI003A807B56
MSTQLRNAQAVDDVRWEFEGGNGYQADEVSFSHNGTDWVLRAYYKRGHIGESHAVWLYIRGAADQPLNGTFNLDDVLTPNRDAFCYFLEEVQEDWFDAYTPTGQVEFKIDPTGLSTGQITALIGLDLKLHVSFSVAQTTADTPRIVPAAEEKVQALRARYLHA